MLTIVTDTKELIPGRWYAIGIKTMFSEVPDDPYDWGGAPLYKYEGDGEWSNDYGEPVTDTWDRDLQMDISINSADAYMLQN
jgi:hypothetical protein